MNLKETGGGRVRAGFFSGSGPVKGFYEQGYESSYPIKSKVYIN
jgi:hypothetical protein